MVSLTGVYNSTSSISARISDLSGTSYASLQIQINGQLQELSYVSGTTYSTTATWYGLTAGTAYYATSYIRSSGGTIRNPTATFYTLPEAPSSVYVSSITPVSATFNWTAPSGNKNYSMLVRVGSAYGNVVGTYYPSSTSTSQYISGLSASTTYYVIIVNSSAIGDTASTATMFTTGEYPPTKPTSAYISSTGKDSFTVVASGSTGFTNYRVEAYNSSGIFVNFGTNTNGTVTVTGLQQFTNYSLKIYARNGGGSSEAIFLDGKTLDGTPPVVTITSFKSDGVMSINWSATDAHSGLRASSKFQVMITGKDNSVWKSMGYTDNYLYSFLKDGDGLDFVHDAKYYMRVIAYDVAGNEASATTSQLTFKRTRPVNWAWTNAKTSGGSFNLTATEWNSLCTRVNQFRTYKLLTQTTFTSATAGAKVTATMYNQVRNSIANMTTTNLPATVSSGETMRASHFNGLVTALNGIV